LKNLYIIFFLLICSHYNYSQYAAPTDSTVIKLKAFFEQLYGADYNLINGRRFVNLYPTAEGYPYLGEDKFYRGIIVINNISYTNVEIKYDICNQKIILKYPHFSGNEDKIILNGEFIEEFEIDGRLFRKYTFPGTEPRFYQVVSQGNIYCLYHWKKELLKGLSGRSFFTYSPEKHLSYLVIDNKLYPFNSRQSFLKLLPLEYYKEIKMYLRSNKIWFRDASDIQIRQLMDFCNKLIRQK
jgi:hypothetical protein